MTLHHLTVPPIKVRHLTNEQAAKVDAAYPALARSPYRCDTCKDTRRFRWYVPEDERDLPVTIVQDGTDFEALGAEDLARRAAAQSPERPEPLTQRTAALVREVARLPSAPLAEASLSRKSAAMGLWAVLAETCSDATATMLLPEALGVIVVSSSS